MYETFRVLTDPDVGLTTVHAPEKPWSTRLSARMVMFDETAKYIGLMYSRKYGYYKLPGGGIDDGELPDAAVLREVLEETGHNAKITRVIGTLEEYRSFEKLRQISQCYVGFAIGPQGASAHTDKELEEGFEFRWIEASEAWNIITAYGTSDPRGRFMIARDAAIVRRAFVLLRENAAA